MNFPSPGKLWSSIATSGSQQSPFPHYTNPRDELRPCSEISLQQSSTSTCIQKNLQYQVYSCAMIRLQRHFSLALKPVMDSEHTEALLQVQGTVSSCATPLMINSWNTGAPLRRGKTREEQPAGVLRSCYTSFVEDKADRGASSRSPQLPTNSKLKSEHISKWSHTHLICISLHPIQSQEAETFSSLEALFSFKLQK